MAIVEHGQGCMITIQGVRSGSCQGVRQSSSRCEGY